MNMLMYQVDIGKYEEWGGELAQCHDWWQNFVKNEIYSSEETDAIFKRNGIIYNGDDTRYVYFDSEERFTAFLLVWS